jgi:hypothetical protein
MNLYRMKKERNNSRKGSSEALMIPSADGELDSRGRRGFARRSFLKRLGMAGATLLPASALLTTKVRANPGDQSGSLTRGDAAILRFLAAAEIIESDLWEQYWELGGNQNQPPEPQDFASTNPATGKVPAFTGGNGPYTAALQILDGDMPQYIQDNTDDEFSHANFLIAYLNSKGASTTELVRLTGTEFRTLPGSQATGSTKKGRLTNLTQLTVDTSYWGRYRSDSKNPDLDPKFPFTQAVPTLNNGQHPAIPRSDADTAGSHIVFNSDGSVDFNNSVIPDRLKVIAFTAGFHFGFIEVGGTSLYPSLAQRVSDPEVLRILLSIGPTETMHFQTWQDKAGNATPVTADNVTFQDLHASTDETLQANLIMPEPCPFLSRKFPICSIIRPTATKGAAMGAVAALTADGLFIGQTDVFKELIKDLAADADAARREFEGEK